MHESSDLRRVNERLQTLVAEMTNKGVTVNVKCVPLFNVVKNPIATNVARYECTLLVEQYSAVFSLGET